MIGPTHVVGGVPLLRRVRLALPATPLPGEVGGIRHAVLVRHHRAPQGRAPATRAGEAFGSRPHWRPMLEGIMGFGEGDVYLSPAPLYHSAPLVWSIDGAAHGRDGGRSWSASTPRTACALIDRYRVTHAQFVPTMFVRMLKLPEEVRASYDMSSLRSVVHAAAPCPPEVKRRMIEWWGPIIHEYYSGTEGMGMTWITSAEALTHPGSVGRPIWGEVHICRRRRRRAAGRRGRGGVLRRAAAPALRVQQRPGEDPPELPRAGLGHPVGRRPRRRGGLPVPDGPQARS